MKFLVRIQSFPFQSFQGKSINSLTYTHWPAISNPREDGKSIVADPTNSSLEWLATNLRTSIVERANIAVGGKYPIEGARSSIRLPFASDPYLLEFENCFEREKAVQHIRGILSQMFGGEEAIVGFSFYYFDSCGIEAH